MFNKSLLYLFLIVSLWSCDHKPSSGNETRAKKLPKEALAAKPKIQYAEKFITGSYQGYTTVTVFGPDKGAARNYVYVLIPKNEEAPDLSQLPGGENDMVQTVRVPLESIVLTSTSYVPALDLLGETNKLKGFPGTDYISSPKVRSLVDEGKVVELGMEASLNIEKLLELAPDAMMEYTTTGSNKPDNIAMKAGIPVLYNADYLEKTPLGRAEWIKFMALFLNKNEEADSVFKQIALRYDSLAELAKRATNFPTVYSGIMYGDTWFMPGGENSGARFLKDAHAKYLWAETKEEGSIKLSFETVYEKANTADYWIGVADYQSLKDIKEASSKYTQFNAFKNKNVYSYNAKMGEKGGFTFLELGYARPDLILADLIKILHPDLLPNYHLFFYQKLQ